MIGADAFSSCTNLTDINLPEGIKKIGDEPFLGCTNLTLITLPEGIKEIGYGAFRSCNQLQQIIISGNDEEVKRISALLPDELQNKVVSKESVLRWQFNVKEGLTQNGIVNDLIKPICSQRFFKPHVINAPQIENAPNSQVRLNQ